MNFGRSVASERRLRVYRDVLVIYRTTVLNLCGNVLCEVATNFKNTTACRGHTLSTVSVLHSSSKPAELCNTMTAPEILLLGYSLLVFQRRIIFWLKMLRSDNLILHTLAGCCRVSVVALPGIREIQFRLTQRTVHTVYLPCETAVLALL